MEFPFTKRESHQIQPTITRSAPQAVWPACCDTLREKSELTSWVGPPHLRLFQNGDGQFVLAQLVSGEAERVIRFYVFGGANPTSQAVHPVAWSESATRISQTRDETADDEETAHDETDDEDADEEDTDEEEVDEEVDDEDSSDFGRPGLMGLCLVVLLVSLGGMGAATIPSLRGVFSSETPAASGPTPTELARLDKRKLADLEAAWAKERDAMIAAWKTDRDELSKSWREREELTKSWTGQLVKELQGSIDNLNRSDTPIVKSIRGLTDMLASRYLSSEINLTLRPKKSRSGYLTGYSVEHQSDSSLQIISVRKSNGDIELNIRKGTGQ